MQDTFSSRSTNSVIKVLEEKLKGLFWLSSSVTASCCWLILIVDNFALASRLKWKYLNNYWVKCRGWIPLLLVFAKLSCSTPMRVTILVFSQTSAICWNSPGSQEDLNYVVFLVLTRHWRFLHSERPFPTFLHPFLSTAADEHNSWLATMQTAVMQHLCMSMIHKRALKTSRWKISSCFVWLDNYNMSQKGSQKFPFLRTAANPCEDEWTLKFKSLLASHSSPI